MVFAMMPSRGHLEVISLPLPRKPVQLLHTAITVRFLETQNNENKISADQHVCCTKFGILINRFIPVVTFQGPLG